MSRRLSDDEKRVFTDQISLLKNENERLTKYIEDHEDDTRKVLEEKCAPDEVHCTCVPVLRRENEVLGNRLMGILMGEMGLSIDDAKRFVQPKIGMGIMKKNVISNLLTMQKKYAKTWRDEDEQFWCRRLREEIDEVVLTLLGKHDGPLEHELYQVASIAINWLLKLEEDENTNHEPCSYCRGEHSEFNKQAKFDMNGLSEFYYHEHVDGINQVPCVHKASPPRE